VPGKRHPFYVRKQCMKIGCKLRTLKTEVVVAKSKGVRGDAESKGSWRQKLLEEHESHRRLGMIGCMCLTIPSTFLSN